MGEPIRRTGNAFLQIVGIGILLGPIVYVFPISGLVISPIFAFVTLYIIYYEVGTMINHKIEKAESLEEGPKNEQTVEDQNPALFP